MATILGFTFFVQARDCPTPQPEYEDLLAQLSDFQSSLLQGPECQGINQAVTHLSQSLNGSKVKLFEKFGSDSTNLSPEEVVELGQSSQQVTRSLFAVINSMRDNQDCTPAKNNPSLLLTIAAVTESVSGVAAQYSGPYGVPVALGGAVLAEVLRGIDLLIQDNDGYRFADSEVGSQHRLLYARNLCVYHNLNSEIDSIIRPSTRISIYKELVKALQQKRDRVQLSADPKVREQVTNYIEWTKKVKVASDRLEKVKKLLWSFGLDIDFRTGRADFKLKNTTPHFVCEKLASFIHDADHPEQQADLKVLLETVKKDFNENEYFKPTLTRVSKILAIMRDPNKGIPDGIQCALARDPEKLIKENQRTISLLAHILSKVEHIYNRHLVYIAESTELRPDNTEEEENKINYVFWYIGSTTKLQWAQRELGKLKRLQLDGTTREEDHSEEDWHILKRHVGGSVPYKQGIVELRLGLQKKLIHILAPKFLAWHTENAEDALDEFDDRFDDTDEAIYDHIEEVLEDTPLYEKYKSHLDTRTYNGVEEEDSIAALRTLMTVYGRGNALPKVRHNRIYGSVVDLVDWFYQGMFSTQTVYLYCKFLEEGKYVRLEGKIAAACDSSDHKENEKSVVKAMGVVAKYEYYLNWAKNKKKVEGNSVEVFTQKIRACYSRLPEVDPRFLGR